MYTYVSVMQQCWNYVYYHYHYYCCYVCYQYQYMHYTFIIIYTHIFIHTHTFGYISYNALARLDRFITRLQVLYNHDAMTYKVHKVASNTHAHPSVIN